MTETIWNRCNAPKESPWGSVQTSTELAPGIWSVSTASHGGLKLSRERNAGMPDYMRAPGGWYEEDCQWSLVALVYPAPFVELRPWQKAGDDSHYEAAKHTARDYFAAEYERFYGVTLTGADSYQRRREEFERATATSYVVLAVWGDWAGFVPPGKVGVVASLGGLRGHTTPPEKWFLVDAAEYNQNSGLGFVVDLARHTEIEEPATADQGARAKAA